MSRPSLAVAAVALLAVLSAAAVGVAAQEATAPVSPTTPDGPSHLAINSSDVAASNTSAVEFDVGTAISTDSASLQSEFNTLWFQEAYANASTEANRTDVIERFTGRIEDQTSELEMRIQENTAAYASGSITASQYLRERARVHARADRLQQAATTVREQLPSRLHDPVVHAEGHLMPLQGPISETLATDVVRSGGERTVYVEVSQSGYTLVRLADGVYTRETYLSDARYPERPERLANGTGGTTAALDRVTELYPWVHENRESPLSTFGYDGIYRISRGYPGGEIRVSLSGGTTEVFSEQQTRSLASFNTTEVINRTSEDVRIAVERTYETGPASVTMRDATTGDPIDGTVEIGGRDSVSVGGDGTYWFVEPRGEVTVNATAAGTDVSVTFTSPAEPPTAPSRTTPGSEG